ncbi:MAG: DNA-deoxyinosine glycosylase [Coriobacteriales bacterium]|jgi:hypoxanthine-DNA glycosylase
MEHLVHPIAPVFDRFSRVLVLGSFPSPLSRENGFFYGNPHNRFWQVLARLFEEPVAATNERKRDQLLRHHIALWDVLASCSIEGASDASIADPVPNDLSELLATASIEAVFCNGAKAAELYARHLEAAVGKPCAKLPSTSPANAAWRLDGLVEAWGALLPHLHEEPAPVLDVPDVVSLERAVDAGGTSLAELMDRAGTFLAHRAHALAPGARTVIFCGSGNNGGDGWVAARELSAAGHEVVVVTKRAPADIKAEPACATAVALAPVLEERGVAILVDPADDELRAACAGCGLVIDAILGTGFSEDSVRAPYDRWIGLANELRDAAAVTVAADVPSGMSAQTGAVAVPCVRADETVTMIVSKPGLHVPGAERFTGLVRVAGICHIEPLLEGDNMTDDRIIQKIHEAEAGEQRGLEGASHEELVSHPEDVFDSAREAAVPAAPAGHPEKPQGEAGRALLERMNGGNHERLAEWGLDHVRVDEDAHVLDIGCGGGANLRHLLERAITGHATGLDYSPLSVATSRETNADAVAAGRCEVHEGTAEELPFADESFDVVTAFETVYYWDLGKAFAEVLRVLKPGGSFLVCNEDDGSDPDAHQFAAQIEGMVLHTAEDLKTALIVAGFPHIVSDVDPESRWIALVARK